MKVKTFISNFARDNSYAIESLDNQVKEELGEDVIIRDVKDTFIPPCDDYPKACLERVVVYD